MTDNTLHLNDFLSKINEIYSLRMNQTLACIRSEIILAIVTGFIAGMFLATLLFVGFTLPCYIYPVLLLNGYTLYLGSKARRRLASDSLTPLYNTK